MYVCMYVRTCYLTLILSYCNLAIEKVIFITGREGRTPQSSNLNILTHGRINAKQDMADQTLSPRRQQLGPIKSIFDAKFLFARGCTYPKYAAFK